MRTELSRQSDPLKYLEFSYRNVSVRLSEKKDEIFVNAEKPVKGLVFEEKRDLVEFCGN
jgi:beta-mannosidase